MSDLKIELIEPTGIDDFDRHVINPFNQRAETINAMNFEFEREEAEQAGATEYLEALYSLDDNWLHVNQARLQIIEYGEAVKKQAQKFTVKNQQVTQIDELFFEMRDLVTTAASFVNS